MPEWTLETLSELDRRYAEEGLHPHQRPLAAAAEILKNEFSLGAHSNPEVQRIVAAYEQMMPEVRTTWPGAGTGLVAVVDQVRRITAPVIFGRVPLDLWKGLHFGSHREWEVWCRNNTELAAGTAFAFADILDLTYGLNELQASCSSGELELWRMTRSNLSSISNTLPNVHEVDAVLQPICMTVELALKASLVRLGADPGDFAKRGGEGHDLRRLAARLAKEKPHRDDSMVREVADRMPPYVASRYAPTGLNRLAVVRLAIAAQFVAASAVRRHSGRDIAGQWTGQSFPGERSSLF